MVGMIGTPPSDRRNQGGQSAGRSRSFQGDLSRIRLTSSPAPTFNAVATRPRTVTLIEA
jgi:hypothetical protein